MGESGGDVRPLKRALSAYFFFPPFFFPPFAFFAMFGIPPFWIEIVAAPPTGATYPAQRGGRPMGPRYVLARASRATRAR